MKNEVKKLDLNRSGEVCIDDILKVHEFKDLTNEEALIVVESLKLFCQILAEMYFITGKI